MTRVNMGQHQNDIDRRKPKFSRWRTFLSVILSTTESTWTRMGVNPGIRDEKPVTNVSAMARSLKLLDFLQRLDGFQYLVVWSVTHLHSSWTLECGIDRFVANCRKKAHVNRG
ncbi:hypothetical protein L798_09475 [Zootermopsis nevadensis]|uniref:Uncharacterized protein n=1 Tax=Zootermopsis nevadensis TaxID=136037 RepID=A0A067RDD6_ZOONE|nr:hypothetical protein L798_09475 [Zootermopsis nevadensis]